MYPLIFINRLLRQNPDVCRELSGFNGLTVGIRTAGFDLCGRINPQGLLDDTLRRPHAVLIIHPRALPELMQGKRIDFNDLAFEGDVELAMNLMLRLSAVRCNWVELLGDEWAEKAAKLGHACQQIAQFLNPHNDAAAQIARLQQQLAQAQQRLDELEQNRAPRSKK